MSRPWMPLYVAEYLADTAHFSATEHGAYLLLIMHYWQTGGLPDDDQLLARICKLSSSQWQKAKALVAPLFLEGWKHKRVEFELTEAARISAAGRTGGKASGQARRQRSRNDRSTIDERPLNDQGNDLATKREALPSLNVLVSSSPTSSSELRETQVERSSGRKSQKTPIPENFVPDARVPNELGWPASKYVSESKRFCEDAGAHDRRYVNWQLAWAKWCRSPYQQQQTQQGKPNGLHGKHAGSILDAIAKLPDFDEGGADQEAGKDPVLGLPPR